MNIERGKIEGDVEIASGLQLHGMITGVAVVKEGGIFVLHGMVCNNVIVEEGAIAKIYGMVCRDLINRGGELEVFGMVNGNLLEESGVTQVSPDAKVGLPDRYI